MTAAQRLGDLSARWEAEAHTPANDEKKEGRVDYDTGPRQSSTSNAILTSRVPVFKTQDVAPDGRAAEKRVADVVAEAALWLGAELYPQPDGTFQALRWGLARRFDSLDEVEAWLLDSAAQREAR